MERRRLWILPHVSCIQCKPHEVTCYSYTLGAMCAVQLYNAAKTDLHSLDDDISNGRFNGLLSWLRCKVHVTGSLYATADQVMVAATGKAIDPKEFTRSPASMPSAFITSHTHIACVSFLHLLVASYIAAGTSKTSTARSTMCKIWIRCH